MGCAVIVGLPLSAQSQSTLRELVIAGHDDKALALINPKSDDNALKYLRGRLLQRQGKPCEASAAFKAVSKKLPESIVDDLKQRRSDTKSHCEQKQKPPNAETPSRTGRPTTVEEHLDVAERHHKRRQFDRAIEVLDKIGEPKSSPELARWLHLKGMSLFRLRNHYPEAARILKRASKLESETTESDGFHAARALSRADKDRAAIRAYRRFAKKYGNSRLAHEARYLAAWLQIRTGSPSAGLRGLRALLKRRRVGKSLRRKALWELGFTSYERRQLTRSINYFKKYRFVAGSRMDRARAHYWTGRARHRMGQRRAASDAYRAAIGVEPLNWYALLAAQRLKSMRLDPGHPFARATPPPPRITVPPLPPDAVFFSALGLVKDAADRLAIKRTQRQVDVGWHAQLGVPHLALRRARRAGATIFERPTRHNRWWWKVAYPTPWRTTVLQNATKRELDPWLVYATMRQESAFNPTVESRAGAIGLLQLMPTTARRVANDETVTTAELKVPERNVELGVAEMAALLSRFDGQFPLSIGAYNAGENRVRQWLRKTRSRDLDRFVERIPFNETRNYIRRVCGHLARYHYLNNPQKPWPLALPKRVKRLKTRRRSD